MRIDLDSGKLQDKELQAQDNRYTWLQLSALLNAEE
jgi:hypothetical protein